MALKKPYTSAQGFECADAYFVIASVTYRKLPPGAPQNATARCFVFVDQSAREDGKSEVDSFDFTFDYDLYDLNPVVQAYAALKQTPEMEGAEDC